MPRWGDGAWCTKSTADPKPDVRADLSAAGNPPFVRPDFLSATRSGAALTFLEGQRCPTARWRDFAAEPYGDDLPVAADTRAEFASNIDQPRNGFDLTFLTRDKVNAKRAFDAFPVGDDARVPFAETFWSTGFGGLTGLLARFVQGNIYLAAYPRRLGPV